MTESITITLGGREFIVKPLLLGPLRRITNLIRDKDEAQDPFGQSIKILAAALAEDYPDVKVEEHIRSTVQELGAAQSKILKLSGLVVEPGAGEAAGAASTGA